MIKNYKKETYVFYFAKLANGYNIFEWKSYCTIKDSFVTDQMD